MPWFCVPASKTVLFLAARVACEEFTTIFIIVCGPDVTETAQNKGNDTCIMHNLIQYNYATQALESHSSFNHIFLRRCPCEFVNVYVESKIARVCH